MNVIYDESNRLLGMLAEVAVKTLNAEQHKHHSNQLKLQKKVNKNVLNLDQLRGLSDKVLVESFSELSCDEIRRIFRFKCVLMPQKCDVVYESFAAEDRARTLMKDHLLDHIRNVESSFTAEILTARKRRLNDNNKCFRKTHSRGSDLTLNCKQKKDIINTNRRTVEMFDKSEDNIDFNSDVKTCVKHDFNESVEDICLMTSKDSYADHCYTSLEGPKVKAIPVEKSDGNIINSKKKCLNTTKVIQTPAFPFIYEPLLPNISQVIEISSSLNIGFNHSIGSSVNIKPKTAKSVEKLDSSQAFSDSVVEELNANALQLRRLALQYISDVKDKNRGQNNKNSFQCKICIDKTFTSPTTLIYHYRSHAGVKPYECTLCKATFTRQHSLNYHMLIHLNKSRFVCDECGRNFRHPSHFKEHMRRHTGETPYECNECFIKFKTRNTYKRHLQTKHAKMLTSKGIFDLPDSHLHLRKPCPPRRKYGLGFLHQNIEAVARYERAQEEVNQNIRSNCHLIDSNLLITNKNFKSNNFEKLLQAVAIAEDDERAVIT